MIWIWFTRIWSLRTSSSVTADIRLLHTTGKYPRHLRMSADKLLNVKCFWTQKFDSLISDLLPFKMSTTLQLSQLDTIGRQRSFSALVGAIPVISGASVASWSSSLLVMIYSRPTTTWSTLQWWRLSATKSSHLLLSPKWTGWQIGMVPEILLQSMYFRTKHWWQLADLSLDTSRVGS